MVDMIYMQKRNKVNVTVECASQSYFITLVYILRILNYKLASLQELLKVPANFDK